MGTIWIKEFTGGLDARRTPETTPPGALLRGRDGHINRGGEFEQRAAFVKTHTLPANTFGLAAGKSSLYVFGRHSAPSMPKGVEYQRLTHPDDASTDMARVLSTDLNAGKLYAVAEFVDGSRHHYYDAVNVEDWIDGRARVALTIDGGDVTPGTAATGSLEIINGAEGVDNRILNVFVNNVGILNTPVDFTNSLVATAAAIAEAINAVETVPNYTASALGAVITITAAVGSAPNGYEITVATTGNVVFDEPVALSGGADASPAVIADLTVDNVSIIAQPVAWRDSHEATAAALADAINAHNAVPEYTAIADGAKVIIVADDPGTAANGFGIDFALQNGFTVSPAEPTMAGGSDVSAEALQAGTFVKTIGSKMYAVAGPNLHFSGIQMPDGWLTENAGAGFVDMSSETSGAEQLESVGEYQNYIAVFASRVIVVWAADPDPQRSRKVQTLRNTGTDYPNTPTQFGDQDLFYLDKNGLRSLRARDSSNAAATTDVGVPVDDLIIKKMKALRPEQRLKVFGLIEPDDGRFWLVFPNEIFVFSHFPGSKIASWTTYRPTYFDAEGVEHTFEIDEAEIFRGKVYLRSGNDIFVYGGLDEAQYDATVPQLWLPYLDADRPTLPKQFKGVDVACAGPWRVLIGMQPTNLDAVDEVATIYRTTYAEPDIGGQGSSTHFSLRFEGAGPGPKKISAAVIHYEADDEAEEA